MKDDMLDLLLESNMKETRLNEKSDSSCGLTIEEVIEKCKLFYFVRNDATSVLLNWRMIALSMHAS
jgi:hypothetical protein